MPSPFKRAMNKAYRLLAYRDRSVHEIRAALKKKEFGEKTIEQVVEKLSGQGYLNDARFAVTYGTAVARRRKTGPAWVFNNLFKKGVARETAADAVEEIFSDEERLRKEIENWVERKLRSYKKELSPLRKKKKLFDFLLGKGFPPDSIFKVFDKWNI